MKYLFCIMIALTGLAATTYADDFVGSLDQTTEIQNNHWGETTPTPTPSINSTATTESRMQEEDDDDFFLFLILFILIIGGGSTLVPGSNQ